MINSPELFAFFSGKNVTKFGPLFAKCAGNQWFEKVNLTAPDSRPHGSTNG